jgi:hypothetical protein
MPEGSVALNSAIPFRMVRITMAPSGATDFVIDNIAVATVPQPALTLFLSATNTVVISWPVPSDGYTLQENSSLGNAAGWVDSLAPIHIVGGQNQAIASPAGTGFYRLLHH